MSALLTRQTKVAIKEENIAVLSNPELEAKLQAEGDAQDDSWEKASKSAGVKIWRTEQFRLVDWPDRGPHVFRAFERYGYFYDEDAYILLHTYKKPGAAEKSEEFSYDLYYWIGQKATLYDVATAAYRSVEIDEYLGHRAVHYRESQGHESERFLKLFPNFMVYRGGRTTQWHHPSSRLEQGVKKIYRMWTTIKQVHEEFYYLDPMRKQIISYEVPIENLEIEQGGVYVYDSVDKLALFSTRASQAWDRFWVGEMAMHIGYSRLGFYNNLAQFDEGTPGDKVFMGLIGVDAVTPMHSRVYPDTESLPAKLYRLAQTVPQLDCSAIELPAALDGLASDAVYVLDDYGNAHYPVVYVWVGKDVETTKARVALVNGEVYLKEKKAKEGPHIALSVAVISIKQGLETPEFLKAFGIKVEPVPQPDAKTEAAAEAEGEAEGEAEAEAE